jgi:membrane-bound ClpP family serine protease
MLFWGLGLLAASLFLVIIEVFVPSGGLIAMMAAGAAIAGIVCLFRVSAGWGLTGLLTLVLLGPLAIGFALKVWPSTPMGRAMLGQPTPEEEEARRRAEQEKREALQALVGAQGTVLTDLRPVGMIEIEGRRYEALSEGSLLRAGSRVRVTVVDGTQIKVRPVA